MLFKWIRPEKNEAVLVGDEAPAGASRGAAGLGVGPPDRVDECPVDERQGELDQQGCDHQRDKRVPRNQLPHRSTRALYQFMNAEMLRLMVRYTIMIMAMPSIAWPVWLMVVLAIDTRSG